MFGASCRRARRAGRLVKLVVQGRADLRERLAPEPDGVACVTFDVITLR